ncbi:hypothetical protein Pfo_007097 [Paulownia fortunei]|nr:hypothetical protein Pfo_007097 [Paulownia fortunei]
MGRIFVVEFQQPNPHYYFCKLCRTHIATAEGSNCVLSAEDTEQSEGVFKEVVNVEVDEPVHYRQVDDHTVADIYCVKCGDILGWKYVRR